MPKKSCNTNIAQRACIDQHANRHVSNPARSVPSLSGHDAGGLFRPFPQFIYAALSVLCMLVFGGHVVAQNSVTPAGNAPGSPAGSYVLSNVETVSLYSGRVNTVVPLLRVGGRGSSGYTMKLQVNDTNWTTHRETHNGATAVYVYPEAFMAARSVILQNYEFGIVSMRYTGAEPGCEEPYPDGAPTCFKYAAAVMVFTEADGTEHPLYDEVTGGIASQLQHPYTTYDWQPTVARGLVFSSKDGTGLTFVSDPPLFSDQYYAKTNIGYDPSSPGFLEEGVSGYLKSSDGTVVRFVNSRAQWIRDRNGNLTTFEYQTLSNGFVRLKKVVDSNNRAVDIVYGAGYEQLVYKGAHGQPRTININYGSLQSRLLPGRGYNTGPIYNLFPAYSHPVVSFANRNEIFNPGVVASVTMPDQRSYNFFYNPYGELARTESPAGGAVEYEYGAGLVPNSNNQVYPSGQVGGFTSFPDQPPIAIYRRALERREYANGGTAATLKTTYSRYNEPVPNGGVREVQTDPVTGQILARRDHHFHGMPTQYLLGGSSIGLSDQLDGKEYRTDTLALNSDTVLGRTETEWLEGCMGPRSVCVYNGVTIPWSTVVKSTTASVIAAAGQYKVSKKAFAYDVYDNATDIYEYHFGDNQPGVLARRTHTDFANSANLVNGQDYNSDAIHLRGLPVRQQVFDAGGMERSRATYEYDKYVTEANHAGLFERAGISGMCTTYNSAGQCSSSNSAGYTTRGNATAVTNYLLSDAGAVTGSVTSYAQYDVAGNVVKSIDARGHETSIFFEDHYGSPDGEARGNAQPQSLGSLASFAYPTHVINSENHEAYTQYDYHTGGPVNTEDANGLITSIIYDDELERPTQTVSAVGTALARQMTTAYQDSIRTVTTTSDLNVYGDDLLKSEVIYDGMGRTTESRNYESASSFITTKWVYDAVGRVGSVSNPYRTTQDSTYGLTTTAYDALGRVESVTKPDGTQVQPVYVGPKVLTTDQAGKQRLTETNALGQLTDVWEIAPADNETVSVPFGEQNLTGYPTHYDYDTLGNLKQVSQSTQPRTFVYDSLSRLISATNPEGGTVEYRYDENGNLVLKIDPRTHPAGFDLSTCSIPYTETKVATCFEYDSLNRVRSRTYNDGTPRVDLVYDTLPNGKGRLTSLGNSASTYNVVSYDALGRATASSQTTGGVTYSMPDYHYNLAGGLTSEQYPSGKVVAADYDSGGRLTGVRNQATNNFYAGAGPQSTDRVQYAPHGATAALKLGNGLWEHADFNERLQIIQIGLGTATTDSSKLQLDFNYGTNDNNGNLRSQSINVPGSLSLTQSYYYDPLNRLDIAREAKVTGGGETEVWKQRFTYDRFGNRAFKSSETTDNVEGPQLAFGPTSNRITTNGYDYDAAGNLTAAPNFTYQYDAENRMVAVNGGTGNPGGAVYSYDGGGRRVKKVTGWETTVYVYNVTGQLVAEYSNQVVGGGVSYLTQDHLGSTRVVTDGGGAPKSRHDYLPFGEEVRTDAVTGSGREGIVSYNPGSVRQKFTGYERDDETGLDFAQARYYASRHGRFTSVDPLAASAQTGAPQTFNRYTYALNNPLRNTDPTGMEAETGHDGEPVQKPTPPPQPVHPDLKKLNDPEDTATDNALAEIFTDGENGLVVGADSYRNQANRFGDDSHYQLADGTLHTIHVYGDDTGNKVVGVYAPKEFSEIKYEGGKDNIVTATNPKTGEILGFAHVRVTKEQLEKNKQQTNEKGSRLLGGIGGPGGEDAGNRHTHITYYRSSHDRDVARSHKPATATKMGDFGSQDAGRFKDFRNFVKK